MDQTKINKQNIYETNNKKVSCKTQKNKILTNQDSST